ncbi:adenylosuccinate synthetase [Pseudomonas chlororaphis]|uniref:adenylosuccinate synthetase n=1 Tax=Pseudomonas chlororaphis TaxID=587753 RepID=UPI0015DF8713|nr:adenylosuccinate synthetase [Pseudomonas chlororaphis]QLL11109.1 adenylosuccinate synthetase [Pseudomonas chlororaphis subsp. aurantiaca]
MGNRQIVVISGKTCTGKTGLAKLLEKEFGFYALRTRDVLAVTDDESLTREELAAREREQDELTNSDWVTKALQARLLGLPPDQPVVVDYVTSPEQVYAFRRAFAENLVHVHLWANTETLVERYQGTEGKDAPPFESINRLIDDTHIRTLKNDADVRIYTTRSDARDTLVRVAARLHLFTSPEVRCVDVLIGGQFGSEGKGNVVSYLAREYNVLVRVGGPNAGHTVASVKGEYTYHHLPSGARDVTARLLLGPGMTIELRGLLKEIADCEISADRLFIDPQATIIDDQDIETEQQRLVGTIASTGSGSGAATARRILDRGNGKVRLARDVCELEPYVGTEGNYHGCTADRLEEAYRNCHSILLEGTQGSGLSLFHGIYPYVTSRDTNVAGCLWTCPYKTGHQLPVKLMLAPSA